MSLEPKELTIDPAMVLRQELELRCKSNPSYSLRAFARALGMSPTALSFVLNGKRRLSKKAAKQILAVLTLSAEEYAALLNWATAAKAKRRPSPFSDAPLVETSAYQLTLDSFSLISDWYHYAILSILEIPGSRFEAKWLSRYLGITEIEARNAMDRLRRMGIVERIDGRWKQGTGPIRIGNDVPTAATTKFQKQLLHKAMESIENHSADVRDFSSMTLAMDPDLVPYAKERIRNFRRKLATELEAKGSPKRVYELTVQIFPVSHPVNVPNVKKERGI